jgi:hypothetical protein
MTWRQPAGGQDGESDVWKHSQQPEGRGATDSASRAEAAPWHWLRFASRSDQGEAEGNDGSRE